MNKPRIVCIGDLMLDVVVRSATAVEVGTDVPGTVRFRLGGSAGNTCRAFAGLGGKAALVCAVGTDPLGKRLIAAHRAANVTVHAVKTRGLTPRLAVLVAPNGERSFVTERAVADSLAAAALKKSWFSRVDVLHLPAYALLTEPLRSASIEAASWVNGRAGIVSVDLASSGPLASGGAASLDAIRQARSTIVFANGDEVRAVVGRRRPSTLLELAPIVVIKAGANGCRVLWRTGSENGNTSQEIEVATKSIRADDTTGAGDAFAAGFLFGFLDGGQTRPFSQILRRAALLGHRSAARVLSMPRHELDL